MKFHNATKVSTNTPTAVYLRQEPGVKRGDPGYIISRSDLMEFLRCPLRWKNGYRQDDTEATEHGTLVDCLFTCPNEFDSRFVVEPATYKNEKGEEKKWSNNANVCKAWNEAQGTKTVVKKPELDDARNAVAALVADPVISALDKDSDCQVMIVAEYHSKEHGVCVPVKCMIDGVPRSFPNLWDLKTCRNGSPGLWPRVIFDRGYDMQAALELALYNAATDDDRRDFCHIVSENVAPWQTARYTLSDDFLAAGRIRIEAALVKYAKCLKTGEWPGYTSSAMTETGWMEVTPLPWMMPNPEEVYGKIKDLPPFEETEQSDLIP